MYAKLPGSRPGLVVILFIRAVHLGLCQFTLIVDFVALPKDSRPMDTYIVRNDLKQKWYETNETPDFV